MDGYSEDLCNASKQQIGADRGPGSDLNTSTSTASSGTAANAREADDDTDSEARQGRCEIHSSLRPEATVPYPPGRCLCRQYGSLRQR
jgi:hypothetical protein